MNARDYQRLLERHEGKIIGGSVVCACGWESKHYASATDAMDEYNDHLVAEGLSLPDVD